MKRRKIAGLAAIGVAGALALAACGGSSGGGGGGGGGGSTGSGSTSAFDAGVSGVVNSSSHKGGTLTFDWRSAPDSFDPGNSYYASVWDFAHFYSLPLMTFAACPGACSNNLVPGLATGPGTVGNNGLTWTYHLRPGIKYEDGTAVTSQDVKYAVERTYARSVLTNGPTYFSVLLGDPSYPGPYKNRAKNLMGLTSVTTPDASTIVFHLLKPFADFNYVVTIPQTAPVPPGKDTGSKYQLHPMSTGPYKFASYTPNKQLTMVKNTNWSAASDPTVKQLADKIVVNMNLNPDDVDNRLLSGAAQVDFAGTGVQAAARAKILQSPSLKALADNPVTGFGWFIYISSQVPPFTNVACRRAVEFAANKVTLQNAYGGPIAGGAIASTVLPPTVVGYKPFDLYEATTKPTGDIAKAKQQLKACGQPNGFTTGIAYRSDRPTETQAAQALQQALGQVGIKTTLHGYPTSTYFSDFAGVPKYVHTHNLGIDFGGWGADWPDGYGFLDQLVNGNSISQTGGNTNIGELNDPVVNKLFDSAANLTDTAARNAIWGQIDLQVMKDAVILPEVYAKALMYRPSSLTNVYFDRAYQLYNFAVMGLK